MRSSSRSPFDAENILLVDMNTDFNYATVHAVSATSVLGPYVDQGYAFDNGPDSGDRHKGHNVSACVLPDSTYCLYVNEIVPFTIFTAASLDGPWTPCKANGDLIQTNGVPVNLRGVLPCPTTVPQIPFRSS